LSILLKDKNCRIASLDIHSPLYLRSCGDSHCGGDIGELYPLIERAQGAGFKLIQFTPIQDTGLNQSPYSGISIFSYNPIHLSVERLPQSDRIKWIKDEYLKRNACQRDHIDYGSLYNYKIEVLAALFDDTDGVINFDDIERNVLAYALFVVLREQFRLSWDQWPKEFRQGNVTQILVNHPELHRAVSFVLFSQATLERQWQEAADFADQHNIEFVFDKPIYPEADSAEVWSNQSLFYLEPDGSPKFVSGCNHPGDPFGPQQWGHAVYRFMEKPDKVIQYFVESIRHLSKISKVIRLDHTLALIWKYYIIDPATGLGKHHRAMGRKLFVALKKSFPDVFFIAEDVGYISESEVDAPLRRLGIPGMRCLQWLDIKKYHQVARYPKLCLAMTSNHDLPSFPAWWSGLSESAKKGYFGQIRGHGQSAGEVIRLVFDSPARIASITLRDIIGDNRPYNMPGQIDPSFWLLQSPVSTEQIDFTAISEIIAESGRK